IVLFCITNHGSCHQPELTARSLALQYTKSTALASRNGSVLDIGNSFPFRLSPSIQQVINITRRSHLQSLRYPLDCHRSLCSQPLRHRHLVRVPFGAPSQFLLPPTPPFQFLRHNPFGVRFHSLLPLRPVMLRPHPLLHLAKQSFAEHFRPQTPPPPQAHSPRPRLPPPPPLPPP